ncbi:hypothetical protein CF328_g7145 [Tilletia controversa]|nr:hypothetical protein CF328_g7145 [Tilletia controversa]
MEAVQDLRFPWNPEKTTDFSKLPRYIGWDWDLDNLRMILPRNKKDKYVDKAKGFQESTPRSLKEVEELVGSLLHVSIVARDLCPYLAELFKMSALFDPSLPLKKHYVPVQVRHDMAQWITALSATPFVRSFKVSESQFGDVVYVDASTEWGIGIVVGERWAAWKWLPGWDAENRGINWGEAVALELGLRAAVAYGAAKKVVTFWSDNQGVIGSYKKGFSHSAHINSVLKRVVQLEMEHRLHVKIDYVESALNPADAPSRGEVLPGPQLKVPDIPPSISVFLDETTGTDGMAKIISSRDDELDPLHALQWHLHLNSSTTADLDSTPLFSYKVSAGSGFRLVPLTKGKMLEVFCDALLRARRPTFSGHSFRIGGATHYWHQGATVDQIKLLGGWASDSFRVYLRDPIAGIAPLQQQLGG